MILIIFFKGSSATSKLWLVQSLVGEVVFTGEGCSSNPSQLYPPNTFCNQFLTEIPNFILHNLAPLLILHVRSPLVGVLCKPTIKDDITNQALLKILKLKRTLPILVQRCILKSFVHCIFCKVYLHKRPKFKL